MNLSYFLEFFHLETVCRYHEDTHGNGTSVLFYYRHVDCLGITIILTISPLPPTAISVTDTH
jgi:hypothetical protein